MAIWHEQKPDCFIVHVDETELTESLIDRMRQVITVAFLNRKYCLLFDLKACTMIDSYFTGLLISTYREAKELGGNLVCVGVTGQVAHAFEVIRLDKVVEVYATLEEALETMHISPQPDSNSSELDEINPDDF